jgi:glycosyltransferase involved in cell wall biosynthesis
VGERKVNVAMDVTPLRLTQAGTARYIRNLRQRLDVQPVAFGGANRASVLARELWWYPFRLSALDGKTDVLHCTTYYGPIRPRVPTVVTVHDLAVLRHPEAFPRWTRTYAPLLIPRVLRAAHGVIAVSEFTATEVELLLRVPREKIHVVPNAVDETFSPDGPRADGDYVLAVGTLEPRKNLARAIEAAAQTGVDLRVVGAPGWGGVEARGANVTWLGAVDDDELARQYRGALCVVYPSVYEGFGLPVLEAMACGAAVVTSSGGATAEVAGDAAVLVDPLDVGAIAAGIETAIAGREALRPRGIERARGFSWDEAARLTQAVYEAAA